MSTETTQATGSPNDVAAAAEQIRANLYLYAQGVDRCDWNQVRSSYHVDGYDDHGSYKGGVDGLIEWLERRHAAIRNSFHFIGNVSIEFVSPTVALVESYAIAYQRYGPEAGETRRAWLGDSDADPDVVVDATLGGRYVDVVEERNGDWRVWNRAVTFEFISAVPVPDIEIDSSYLVSKRDASDTLYAQQKLALSRASGRDA